MRRRPTSEGLAVQAAGSPAAKQAGTEMYNLIRELYPLCRSMTGDGVRGTLRILGRSIPLEVREVPSGTPVLDWTVPKEWNIRDAYVKNSRGEKVIDFGRSNLHVVGYSTPVRAVMPLAELKEHLFSLPEKPEWIPYRTAYFRESWGFCISHAQLLTLPEERYEVVIDTTLADGHLTYGELLLNGEREEEVLISTHVCHPSLCNDNLSGVAVAAHLASALAGESLKYSYRFVFLPATIGSITWLALNRERVRRIRHGLVLAGLGDPGKSTYKKSRRGSSEIDRVMRRVLSESDEEYEIIDFFPYGYDERQYCSPGFDLPVGCLMRTPHDRYPEYHTSADNLEFVTPSALADSFGKLLAAVRMLERNGTYLNLNPYCEPQLGRRGIYRSMADGNDGGAGQLALLWVLNMSDGSKSLLDICDASGLQFDIVHRAADLLVRNELLKEIRTEIANGGAENGGR